MSNSEYFIFERLNFLQRIFSIRIQRCKNSVEFHTQKSEFLQIYSPSASSSQTFFTWITSFEVITRIFNFQSIIISVSPIGFFGTGVYIEFYCDSWPVKMLSWKTFQYETFWYWSPQNVSMNNLFLSDIFFRTFYRVYD